MTNRKGPPRRLLIDLDGTRVEGANATERFVETLKRIGPALVEPLGFELSGTPLISREPTSRTGERRMGPFYIATHSDTLEKAHVLSAIADRLGLDLRVQVINPREEVTRLLSELEQ